VIALTGLLLLAFILLVFVVCLRVSAMSLPATRGARVAIGLIAALLLAMLMRPEEEIEIGEDPGVYFNAAASFARHDALAFQDPAFARIPAVDRILFKYGHAGFMLTKDNSLWSRDISMQETRAHFYPGYSLLLALPMKAGFPYGAFWVSIALAILTGLLVTMLCRLLTASATGGWIGFFLYFLNPVIIWNARCLRAEWPASFLALAGIVLWQSGMEKEGRGRFGVGLLSGFALTTAGLFHATALYVLLPALVVAFFLSRGTRFWAGWWAGAVAGILLVVGQWAFIADPYYFWPRVQAVLVEPWFIGAGCAALLSAVALRWAWQRCCLRFPGVAGRVGSVAGWLAALSVVAVVAYSLRHRTELGQLPGLPAWSVAYISLTDFEGVARVISRVWFAFSLLGLFFLGTGRGEQGRTGRLLLLLLGPASMTIGWVFNYMFETRRMLTFLAPLLTLASLAGIFGVTRLAGWMLQRWLPDSLVLKRWVVAGLPWVMALMLLLAGVRGRLHLYTTWNDQGAYRFYREVAERVKKEGDFLLAEYTQMAAPVERLSELPLLPVSWGYRSQEEYRRVEEVWRRLVAQSPEERFLFISPFAGAALPGLEMEPLFTHTLETKKLGRARRTVPMEVQDRTLTLHVSRVLPPAERRGDIDYVRLMDGGNLGLAGQANFMHNRDIAMQGVPARSEAGGVHEIAISRPGRAGILCAFVAAPEGVDEIDLMEGWRFMRFGDRWGVVRLPVDHAVGEGLVISLSSAGSVYLTDLFLLPDDGGVAIRQPLEGAVMDFTLSDVHSQWLRASASVALPVAGEGGHLMLLATHGRDGEEEVGLRVSDRGEEGEVTGTTIASGWRWYMIPMPAGSDEHSGMAWHDLEVTPAWNPGLSNFPEDLGLRVAVMGSLSE
jgi:hypothetical protein